MKEFFHLAPTEWSTLRRLLDQALDLAPHSRAAWVEGLDAQFDRFKSQLSALLAHASDGALPIDTLPRLEATRPPGERAASLQPGAEVGPYRLIRLLGEGGMGTVWLAERTDMLHRRQFALKLPRLLTSGARLGERLAHEREILAVLSHPNIARLYDAGITDDQPWLALEYVDGEPIDAHCNRKQLDLAARLRLFLQVARAVAHAHANLIVHRDLKPSNILVTEPGEVRLLDFGISKLLEEGRARESELTQLAGRALTPDYAAPEQILGQPISTATDVYALGVVLYGLLTGKRPYRLKRDSRAALEEAIAQAEVERPSDAAGDRKLGQRLRGDLDTILLKALKKDPSARYGTVEALAADVERYLARRPVLAQPDSPLYRLRKFVGRNMLAVGAAAGIVTALIAGATLAAWQAYEAQRQRDAAYRAQRRAEEHNKFLDLMLDSIGEGGKPLTLPELLDHGVGLLETDTGLDTALKGNLLLDMAYRYATLGRSDKQLELLDRAIGIARDLDEPELLAAAQCAACSALLARDGGAARDRLAVAEAALPRASDRHTATTLACARARAQVQQADGNIEQAISTLGAALRELREEPVAYPGLQVAMMAHLAELYYKSDRIAEALDLNAETLALLDRTGRGGTMTRVIHALNYAAILARAGEVAEAAAAQRRALAIARGFDGAGGLPAGFALHLAGSLMRLAQYDEALVLVREDLEHSRAGGNTRFEALGESMLGGVLVKLGRFDEAEAQLVRAEAALQVDRQTNARLLNELALTRVDLLLGSARPREAGEIVTRVLADLGYPAKRKAPGIGGALYAATRVALADGDGPRAERLATDGLGAAEATARDPRRSANVGQARLLRARARRMQGLDGPAREDAEAAAIALGAGFGADHPETREARALLEDLARGQARNARSSPS